MPGKWRSDNSPWVREIMEVFADNKVRDISIMCSAQSAKTQTMICCALWAISEDAGPLMWVMAAKDEVESFVRNRIKPPVEDCAIVYEQLTDDLNAIKLHEINFQTMTAYFRGANSPSKLQSVPIRWLMLDEVRNYPKMALDTVLKRTRAFWNTRRLVVSTPADVGDSVDRLYKAGDQRVIHTPCPNCGQLNQLNFNNLKWETNEKTKKDGLYDFDELAKTIVFEFPCCQHRVADEPTTRKAIARDSRFVRMNPSAPKHRVSFHWNALLPPWVKWSDLVEEYLSARAALRTGDVDPMKTFINETCGRSWEDRLGEIEDFSGLDDRKGDFDFAEPWSEETTRFMAADRQGAGGEHYWYVIRAFGEFGQSRLIGYGKCNSTEELEKIRDNYGVKPQNSVLDTGYKATECYRFCSYFGWRAFKGDQADYFLYRDKRRKKTVRRIYQKTSAEPTVGKRKRLRSIPLYRWSNTMVKDLLSEFIEGLIGDWQITRTIGRDYQRQMTAEAREPHEDARGRITYRWNQKRKDNHLWDCELMIMVAAIISKTIAIPDHEDEDDG